MVQDKNGLCCYYSFLNPNCAFSHATEWIRHAMLHFISGVMGLSDATIFACNHMTESHTMYSCLSPYSFTIPDAKTILFEQGLDAFKTNQDIGFVLLGVEPRRQPVANSFLQDQPDLQLFEHHRSSVRPSLKVLFRRLDACAFVFCLHIQ